MNLARSLLAAAERHPDARRSSTAASASPTPSCSDRAARLAAGLGTSASSRGDRLAAVLTNRAETVALYWACQWLGASFVPLSQRASARTSSTYCIEDAGAP